jgi:hypothetical protein
VVPLSIFKQRYPVDLCNGEVKCFLRGTDRILKYDSDEFSLQRDKQRCKASDMSNSHSALQYLNLFPTRSVERNSDLDTCFWFRKLTNSVTSVCMSRREDWCDIYRRLSRRAPLITTATYIVRKGCLYCRRCSSFLCVRLVMECVVQPAGKQSVVL